MWQLVYNFYLFVSSAAVFVLLARSARTGIVPADFFRLHDCSGLLLLHIELMLFFLIENSVPFRQLIEPVGFGIDHVLVETFLIEAEVHFSVLKSLIPSRNPTMTSSATPNLSASSFTVPLTTVSGSARRRA